MVDEVLEIRAHHLLTLRTRFKSSREAMVRSFIEGGYAKTSDDPFIAFSIEGVKSIFLNNPNQKFRVVVNKLDFMCNECIFGNKKRGICTKTPLTIAASLVNSYVMKDMKELLLKEKNLKYGNQVIQKKREFILLKK